MCARETTVTPARDEPTDEQTAHAPTLMQAMRETAHSFRKSTAQRPLPLPQKNSLHLFRPLQAPRTATEWQEAPPNVKLTGRLKLKLTL